MSTMLELPAQYWPAVLILISSILGLLRVMGLLSRPADSGDLKVFQTKLEVLENLHHENREEHGHIRSKNEAEHQAIRNDISQVSTSIAHLEGVISSSIRGRPSKG